MFDNLQGDSNSLFFGVLGIFHALDKFVRHTQASDIVAHVACHAGRFHRNDASQNVDLLVQATLAHQFHVPGETLHVINPLRLDEIGPGADLLLQPEGTEVEGIGERIGRRADEQPHAARDLVAAQELSVVPHVPDHLDELQRVNVMHVLRFRMVAELLMVTRKTKQIANTQRHCPQDTRLHGDAIAVTARHLHYRIESYLFDDRTCSHAGHSHHGCLVIGDVDRVYIVPKDLGLTTDKVGAGALGRPQLPSDGKMSFRQHLLQIGFTLHIASSFLGRIPSQ